MCKTDSEIATALSKSYIQMAFVNTYFDVEDYSHPIKDFLDDSIYDYLVSGYTKQISTFVKQNTISLKDTIYRYSPDGTEDSFICKTISSIYKIVLFIIVQAICILYRLYSLCYKSKLFTFSYSLFYKSKLFTFSFLD